MDVAFQLYQYEPLEAERNIRLLHLWPHKHGDDHHITCTLVEHTFDGELQYEAVSWCWGEGEESPSQHLLVEVRGERHQIMVRTNLWLALKTFRSSDGPRVLWIDAICINQKDVNEKNSQIPLMAPIFSKAVNVCVWLGASDSDTAEAFQFLQDLVQTSTLSQRSDSRFGPTEKLMRKPWFTRRWVIQEIALARDATLHCGSSQMPWKDFTAAIFVLENLSVLKPDQIPGGDRQKWNKFIQRLPDFGATLLVKETEALFTRLENGEVYPVRTLPYLVSKLTPFQSSEPRDAFYALLAIAKDTTPQPYPVDYRKAYSETCEDFIQHTLNRCERTTALDIICRPWVSYVSKSSMRDQSTDRGSTIPLPSWIPSAGDATFALMDHGSDGVRIYRQNADPLVGGPDGGPEKYSAADSKEVTLTNIKFNRGASYHNMFVEGFVLDKVRSIAESSSRGRIPSQWLRFGGWTNLKEDPPEALWKTLVAGRGPSGRTAPTAYQLALKYSIGTVDFGDDLDPSNFIKTEFWRTPIIVQFFNRVQNVIWNRRLMNTGSSRLGLVHRDTREGDLICILYGCSVPVVLREVSKNPENILTSVCQVYEHARETVATTMQWISYPRKPRKASTASPKKGGHRKGMLALCSRYWASFKLVFKIAFYLHLLFEFVYWEPTFTRFLSTSFRSNFFGYFCLKVGFISPLFGFVFLYLFMAIKRQHSGLFVSRYRYMRSKRTENYYKFIGPCYVHGVMDGEAIKHSKDDRVEIFELR